MPLYFTVLYVVLPKCRNAVEEIVLNQNFRNYSTTKFNKFSSTEFQEVEDLEQKKRKIKGTEFLQKFYFKW